MYWGNGFRGPILAPRPNAQTNPKEHLLGGVGRQGMWGCLVGLGPPHLGVRVRYRANWPANCGVDSFVNFRYGANGHGHQTGQMRLPIGPQAKVGILAPLGKHCMAGANRYQVCFYQVIRELFHGPYFRRARTNPKTRRPLFARAPGGPQIFAGHKPRNIWHTTITVKLCQQFGWLAP